MPVFLSTFAMVGARRIARRRADAAVAFANHVLARQVLGRPIAPLVTNAFVEILGRGFGQPVGQRLGHDRVVIVMVMLEFATEVVRAKTG
jgi:hypothetical protein